MELRLCQRVGGGGAVGWNRSFLKLAAATNTWLFWMHVSFIICQLYPQLSCIYRQLVSILWSSIILLDYLALQSCCAIKFIGVFIVSPLNYVDGTMVAHITVSYILFTFMHIIAGREKSIIIHTHIFFPFIYSCSERKKQSSYNNMFYIIVCLANWKKETNHSLQYISIDAALVQSCTKAASIIMDRIVLK